MSRIRGSAMGSSKYEFDPDGLDRDIADRAEFLKTVARPMIVRKAMEALKDGKTYTDIMGKKTGSFHLSYEGVEEYAMKLLMRDPDE